MRMQGRLDIVNNGISVPIHVFPLRVVPFELSA